VVNRKDTIKTPAGLQLIAGAAQAITRLTAAGFNVAICTNRPEVARGTMSHDQLDAVHERPDAPAGGKRRTHRQRPVLHVRAQDPAHETRSGDVARGIGAVWRPGRRHAVRRCPGRGSQGRFHAGCPRMLGAPTSDANAWKTACRNLQPVAIYDDLAVAVDAHLVERPWATAGPPRALFPCHD
jgi:D-glycero-D-manno-heptose 1,7-bisphosphate phosphatase